jgi:transcription elongation GreA/GreB family factor
MKKVFFKKEGTIPFTKEGYEKVLEEKTKLLAARPEAVEHLAKARQMGDLSENGYYKASRARLSFLDAQIRRNERLVRLGRIVQATGSGSVEIGSLVTISDGTNQYSYTIVGGYESDPAAKTISHVSPIGKALMGKRIQETIEVQVPAGIKKYTVLAIA